MFFMRTPYFLFVFLLLSAFDAVAQTREMSNCTSLCKVGVWGEIEWARTDIRAKLSGLTETPTADGPGNFEVRFWVSPFRDYLRGYRIVFTDGRYQAFLLRRIPLNMFGNDFAKVPNIPLKAVAPSSGWGRFSAEFEQLINAKTCERKALFVADGVRYLLEIAKNGGVSKFVCDNPDSLPLINFLERELGKT